MHQRLPCYQQSNLKESPQQNYCVICCKQKQTKKKTQLVTPQVYQGLPLLPFSAVLLEDVRLLLELPSLSSRCGQSS